MCQCELFICLHPLHMLIKTQCLWVYLFKRLTLLIRALYLWSKTESCIIIIYVILDAMSINSLQSSYLIQYLPLLIVSLWKENYSMLLQYPVLRIRLCWPAWLLLLCTVFTYLIGAISTHYSQGRINPVWCPCMTSSWSAPLPPPETTRNNIDTLHCID